MSKPIQTNFIDNFETRVDDLLNKIASRAQLARMSSSDLPSLLDDVNILQSHLTSIKKIIKEKL